MVSSRRGVMERDGPEFNSKVLSEHVFNRAAKEPIRVRPLLESLLDAAKHPGCVFYHGHQASRPDDKGPFCGKAPAETAQPRTAPATVSPPVKDGAGSRSSDCLIGHGKVGNSYNSKLDMRRQNDGEVHGHESLSGRGGS